MMYKPTPDATCPSHAKRNSLALGSFFCFILFIGFVPGCGTIDTIKQISGKQLSELAVRSLDHEDTVLQGNFQTRLYHYHDDNRLTILLIEGEVENPSQVLIIRMLWRPRGSKTPVSANATNATFRHLVFAGNNSVGIYGGGGYFYPKGKLGKAKIKGAIWDGTLALQHKAPNFVDRLGRAKIEGKFKLQRDDAAVNALLKKINILVRQKLGYPVLVKISKPITEG